jgi:hypothetical protein
MPRWPNCPNGQRLAIGEVGAQEAGDVTGDTTFRTNVETELSLEHPFKSALFDVGGAFGF